MKKENKIQRNIKMFAAAFILCSFLVSQTGCVSKTETDEASRGVIKISITPRVTPTPELSEIDQSAVVTNGNLTMINEYLAEKSRE
jgi:hypothetical protein